MSLKVRIRRNRVMNDTSPSSSTLHSAPVLPSTSALHSTSYRNRLKQDPVKWAEFKEKEATRARIRRKNLSEESKIKQKEQSRIRQQRFVANHQSSMDEDGQRNKTKQKKILTRNERDKTREYNRQKKRESRERMTPQQKRRSREKDAKRKMEKRLSNKKRKPKKTKKDIDTPNNNSTYNTSSARRMAISRMWANLPKQAEKFADIVADFVDGTRTTPRKKSALRNRGIASRRELKFQDTLQTKIRSSLSELKNKRDSVSLINRRVLTKSLLISKTYRMKGRLALELDLRPGYVSKLSKEIEQHGTVKITRKKRNDSTCIETVNNIQAFYRTSSIARELPCMRTIKKGGPKFTMEVSTAQAYKMWKTQNPGMDVVSLSVFQKLRPTSVLLQRATKLNQCLCEYCTSILLKLQALNRVLSVCKATGNQVKNKYDLVDLTMCDKGENRFHQRACINRTCPDCGVSRFKSHFAHVKEEHGERVISWQTWEQHAYIHDGKNKTKRIQRTKTGTLSDLLEALNQEVGPLAKHIFTADWQGSMYSLIRAELPPDWCLFVLDFAENYSCVSQDEIQSAHWATDQVTVHPIVCFYHCRHEDGETHIAQEALVFLSNDLKHDHHLVHHFESLALQHLKDVRDIKISHVVEFTDGCSSQYKSRSPFADISFSQQYFNGVSFERNFFGSRHGKGPSDGVSGCVKSTVRRAVISRRTVVNSAEEMFSFCVAEMTLKDCSKQRRSFLFVKKEDVDRNRPEIEIKSSLLGTRGLHAVKCIEPGVLDTRLLSCFCDGCIYPADGKTCLNSAHVIPWQRRALKMVNEIPIPNRDDVIVHTVLSKTCELPGIDSDDEQGNLQDMWKIIQGSGNDSDCDDDTTGLEELTMLLDSTDCRSLERADMADPVALCGPASDTLKVKSFDTMKDYAVYYSHPPKFYIGRVLEEENEHGVRMKFLQQKPGCNDFTWPKSADIQTVDPVYIFHGPITLIGHHPFVIAEQEFNAIKEKYAKLKLKK